MRNITIDFNNPGLPQVIDVMQSDSQSRFIGLTLYDGGVPYSAPSGAVYTVEYHGQGANNTGWYDTIQLSSGTRKAVVVSSSSPNVVTIELAEQALRVNGKVEVSLCVVNNTGYKLNTFPIICRVTGAPYVDPVSVRSFFYVTGLTSDQWTAYVTACQDAQKRAEDAAAKFVTDPTLKLEGKAADAKATGDAVSEIKEDLENTVLSKKEYTEVNGFAISKNYGKVILSSSSKVYKIKVEPVVKKYIIHTDRENFYTAFSYNELIDADITVLKIVSANYSTVVENQNLAGWLYVGNDSAMSVSVYEEKEKYFSMHPENFGAVGDGINDDTLHLQRTIDFCLKNKIKLEFTKGKVYCISNGLTINIPRNVYIDFNYAEIKAIANIQRMITVKCDNDVVTSDSPVFDYNNLKNVRLNHNGFSGGSIYINYGNNLTIDGVLIENCRGNALQIDAGGVNVANGYIICKHGNSVGINITTSDSHFSDLIIVNASIAINNSGTNFYTRVHGWNTGENIDDTTFFAHASGNAQLIQCQCDTYERGYVVSTDRRLSLTNCTYYFNSNVYKGDKTPIVFFYAETARNFARNTSCVNCTFDSFKTDIMFSNFPAMMINLIGCWHKGKFIDATYKEFDTKTEIRLNLSDGISSDGNTWNQNSLSYRDDTVRVRLALNVSKKSFGSEEVKVGTIPQPYWYPKGNLVVPCYLYTDEYDTKWYPGYIFVNKSNGNFSVKANQSLKYQKLICNFDYELPQIVYNG